ncbi:MAG TPA: DUF805 domain-containing protein [Gemmatimonadales bacterium]|jgi:uncharacterized membrane protein YhaH (DUF805 family)
MNAPMPALGWLFDPRGRVSPRTYLRTGLSLLILKYAVDAALVGLVLHRLWRPTSYPWALFGIRTTDLADAPGWFLAVMAVWAVPFLVSGISLSVRRLYDAGYTPFLALIFLVPFVNYLLMGALCLMPSRPAPGRKLIRPPVEVDPTGHDALSALAASVAITVPMVAVNTLILKTYSASLFLGTPFSLGVLTAYFYNWKRVHSQRATLGVVSAGVFAAAFALIFVAVEGASCLIMAAPLALIIALPGAVIGREIAIRGAEDVVRGAAILLLLPLVPVAGRSREAPLHEVRSVIIVAAPPEVVWRRVIAFGEIGGAPGGIFRFGIAYPERATIAGEGVGAVRRCEFSTGAFVEPITVWDASRRLAFDVTDEPPPMREMSPWSRVHAPHLDGYLRSRHGEFRLTPVPGGTRLEGITWYTLDMEPRPYWEPFADAIIHRIHLRVLRHVQHLAEADLGRTL